MSPLAALGVHDAAARLAAGEAILIDVREPDEFAAAHIEGAIPAPLSRMPAAWHALDLPEGKTLIIQCLKGGRSAQVCGLVGPTGPAGQPVFNLTGGIQAWHEAGLPVVFASE